MPIKFHSLSLKEYNRLKVSEGRVWKNIEGSDTEKNRKIMEKICVKYLIERSREEEWQAEDMLQVWKKREMYKPKLLQTVGAFVKSSRNLSQTSSYSLLSVNTFHWVNPLQHNNSFLHYCLNLWTMSMPSERNYALPFLLRINSSYFPEHHQQIRIILSVHCE